MLWSNKTLSNNDPGTRRCVDDVSDDADIDALICIHTLLFLYAFTTNGFLHHTQRVLLCAYMWRLLTPSHHILQQDHFIPSYAKNMDSALHTLIETFVLPQHVADAQQVQPGD